MTTFGAGFGRDKNLLKSRPCNTTASFGKQKFVNSWSEQDDAGDKFRDSRWDRKKLSQEDYRRAYCLNVHLPDTITYTSYISLPDSLSRYRHAFLPIDVWLPSCRYSTS